MNVPELGWPAGLAAVLDAAMDAAADTGAAAAVDAAADAGTAEAVDAAVGRGATSCGPFGTARSARLDAREEFPAEECAVLDRAGIARGYVPAGLGGVPGGLPELLHALRTVARRDVTVAVAHGKTFLGAVCVWVAGSRAQRSALARLVTDEHAVVSWGLTEPGHGSDLLAGELTATRTETGGWLLDGRKWPVNNATRGRLICVLARTEAHGGPRGFSLFLVDKATLRPGTWAALPKEPTHGIRGADISGIRFDGAELGPDALIGRVGDGLTTVLRSLQLTRTLCAALSLGAGEHALRLAHDFAAGRTMYGTRLIGLPLARRTLGRAAAGLALAEAATLVAARSAHCLPREMSVTAAVTKAGVPAIVQQTIDDLAELLGARGFLTSHADGMFQKLERDHRIVSVFDGSTAVNRAALVSQFPLLAARRDGGHDAAGLAGAADVTLPLPDLDPAALRLTSTGGCSVVAGLPAAVARLGELAAAGRVPHRAHRLAGHLAAEAASLADAMSGPPPAARATPPEAFALAHRFELCFAGAAAAHLLHTAPDDPDRTVRLTAALERCAELLRGTDDAPPEAYEEVLRAVAGTSPVAPAARATTGPATTTSPTTAATGSATTTTLPAAPAAPSPPALAPRSPTPPPDATDCDAALHVDALEKLFGDAADTAGPVGRAAVLAADERAEMLAAGEQLLTDFGLNAHFVPAESGGRLTGLDGLVAVMRAVYRRDPCLGLGYGAGSFMAAVNVWTAGGAEQRARLAARLLDGDRVACAYHELAHGNDFSRAGLTALPGPDGTLRLDGRKEVVANLGRAESMVLFARTDPAPGNRSHSQLLLDTDALDPARVRRLARFGTTGMRGVQLGGIAFTGCPVPAGSVVGTVGHGVETALRSFQLTRIALPGMIIGLLDTALRTALRGARGRRLYGGSAADLPLSRAVLAESFADLLLADTFTDVAARAAHTATRQVGSLAAAVKAVVPRLLMTAVYRLSELLGSQFYLRHGERPLFQKLLRDVQPSAFGHASRVSCQSTLLAQLPLTARRSWLRPDAPELPAATFARGRPLPALDFGALAVTSGGRDPLSRSLVNGAAAHPDDPLGTEARTWVAELGALADAAGTLSPGDLGPAAPPGAFALTTRWAGVLAASACLNTWWHRPAGQQGFAADPAWVRAALHRLGAHLGRHRDPLPATLSEPLYAELVRRLDAGLTFDTDCRPTGA